MSDLVFTTCQQQVIDASVSLMSVTQSDSATLTKGNKQSHPGKD